jgi:hypothetical protein
LITRRIEHFDLTLEKIHIARAKLKNKVCFDKTHRLQPIAIKEGHLVLISNNNWNMQYSPSKNFAHKFKGPYVVTKVHDNATYSIQKLDGAKLQT